MTTYITHNEMYSWLHANIPGGHIKEWISINDYEQHVIIVYIKEKYKNEAMQIKLIFG
jgi:hypothetical protein